MKILITGTAGFIGMHLAERLLERGDEVIGLDSINDYYDVNLKYGRLAKTGIPKEAISYGKVVQSEKYPKYRFVQLKLEDKEGLFDLFAKEGIDKVVNLAAQAGVRYSLTNPDAYIEANIVGFIHILEACRHYRIKHLAYASSSSVYGSNTNMPFSTSHNVDHPVSLYAASKKSNELMAHTYSHLFGIPTTGLRFFTVYGPWGRPDMALFLFTKAMKEGRPIQVFNYGNMQRDFTYIDDIVEGVIRVVDSPPIADPNLDLGKADPSVSKAPYKVYNIGNSKPEKLLDFIHAIEESLGVEAIKDMLPIQPGDVPATYADTSALERELGYKPDTPIKVGVGKFVDWYNSYYQ
ncbi:dTDP-glucose 4,6-dehydratase [Lunatimonas lonarensis]|uniref:dTDP-glucose 4,6-dehydratase n=1 Tax=Lunatimonas lonarensis TaxID=1232681 RepID=R7ZTM6_9BACT|nr:NAD-dependent epimerase [Lunatimonas lonarensis]EON77496.1 dTDP-glucose 4,6-dehydratase [Lunatimonas lonarensis]